VLWAVTYIAKYFGGLGLNLKGSFKIEPISIFEKSGTWLGSSAQLLCKSSQLSSSQLKRISPAQQAQLRYLCFICSCALGN